jgi:hypothetical protein
MKQYLGYQLTEEEAEKIIAENTPVPKPAPVVEPPDDWVELCDPEHILRMAVDEYFDDGPVNGWMPIVSSAGKRIADCTSMHKFRCRRKHLPPPPPTAPPADIPPSTIPVRLWTSHRLTFEGGDWPVRCGEQIPTGVGHHVEIKVGPNGFYIEKE